MELNNEFEVDRPVDETWVVLTDVERIAPCLPGAQLQEIEGDEYRGVVKVKVGPITAQYKGKATFVEKDDAAHKAVLKAEGRDSRGQGNASALITAQLAEVGPARTKVTVNTDLTVTGKVAQFGRGVMGEVSEKLLKQFVENLEEKVLSQPSEVAATARPAAASTSTSPPAAGAAPAPGSSSTTGRGSAPSAAGDRTNGSPATAPAAPPSGIATPSTPASPGVRTVTPSEPVEPVDLLGATGGSLAKRLLPLVGGALVIFVLLKVRGRRRRRRASLPAALFEQGSAIVREGLSDGSALLARSVDEGTALLNEGAARLRRGGRRHR